VEQQQAAMTVPVPRVAVHHSQKMKTTAWLKPQTLLQQPKMQQPMVQL